MKFFWESSKSLPLIFLLAKNSSTGYVANMNNFNILSNQMDNTAPNRALKRTLADSSGFQDSGSESHISSSPKID